MKCLYVLFDISVFCSYKLNSKFMFLCLFIVFICICTAWKCQFNV